MSYHIFRDPIHGNIYLNQPEDDILLELIDTKEFQRLRRITQLGTVNLTYPGAEHSRFSHSLGVLHLMTLALDHLQKNADEAFQGVVKEYSLETRIAALLHDIGHGPFSHTFENIDPIKTKHHEEWTSVLIQKGPEIPGVLLKYGIDPKAIVHIIEKKCEQPIFSELLSGHLDVDRMDYLLRDSHQTGVKYGIFDWERILASLIPIKINGIHHLGLSKKGIHSMEEFILSRYFMYEQVYLHKTVLSTEFLLQKIFRRVYDLVSEKKLIIRHPVLQKLFSNEPLSVEEFLRLDDHFMHTVFFAFDEEDDPILTDLTNRFLHRNLLKVKECKKPEEVTILKKVATEQGFDPKYYIGELTSSLTPYPKTQTNTQMLNDFPIKFHNKITSISAISPIIKKFKGYEYTTLKYAYPAELFD